MSKPLSETTLTLIKTRELISDPKRWTRNNQAIDSSGFPTNPRYKDAAAFCALGALNHIGGQRWEVVSHLNKAAEKYVVRPCFTDAFVIVNDICGHETILKVFDEAIALSMEAGELPK